MLSRACLRLAKSNKLSLIPKRSIHESLFEYGPPKNHITSLVSLDIFNHCLFLYNYY
jgi:hypothetical protein